MLGKKLGKYSFGFADAGKGKAKERTPLGSVKVGQLLGASCFSS
jgi:U3 small nucleolar RNA-associated protein 21